MRDQITARIDRLTPIFISKARLLAGRSSIQIDDLVQEARVKALELLQDDPSRSDRLLVFGARNAMIDCIRKEFHRQHLPLFDHLGIPAPCLFAEIEDREYANSLFQAVHQSLRPSFIAFALGETCEDISARTGLSYSAVRYHVSAARSQVRQFAGVGA